MVRYRLALGLAKMFSVENLSFIAATWLLWISTVPPGGFHVHCRLFPVSPVTFSQCLAELVVVHLNAVIEIDFDLP